jgi:transcriptional regulator with XRE-family HTH domain
MDYVRMTKSKEIDEGKFPYWRIGRRLAALRETTKMSKTDFAAFCDFNYTRYINWESGHRRMLPDDAEVLCDKFGVTLDFIYRGIEAQLPQSLAIALSSNPRVKATNISSETPD